MANTTIYPYGTNGQLPSSIGVINDLTTGGADKALSAEMGKELAFFKKTVDTSIFYEHPAFPNPQQWAVNYQNLAGIFVPVYTGEKYELSNIGTNSVYYGCLTTGSYNSNDTVSYANGTTRVVLGVGNKEILTIPTGCRYLYISTHLSSAPCSFVLERVWSYEELVSERTLLSPLDKADVSNSKTLGNKTVLYSDVTYVKGNIEWNTGYFRSGTNNYSTDFIDLGEGEKPIIIMQSNHALGTNFIFYDSSKSMVGLGTCSANQTSALRPAAGSDYRYVRVVVWSNTAVTSPETKEWRLDCPVIETGNKYLVNPLADSSIADPTIWYCDGYYYMSGTGLSRKPLRSVDLCTWEDCGYYLYDDATRSDFSGYYIWAPQVIKWGNEWRLYCSVIGLNGRSIVLCRAKRPDCPFNYNNEIIMSGGCIDPFVVYGEDNKLWLFYTDDVGTFRIEMNEDGTGIKTGATATLVAGSGYGTYHSEGTTMFRRKNWWYLFYSMGSWTGSTYRICVGRSQTIGGTFYSKDGNPIAGNYAPAAILQCDKVNGEVFYGTGHCGEILVDKEGKTYMVYHSWWMIHSDERKPMLQELLWDDEDWPYFEGGKPAHRAPAPIL